MRFVAVHLPHILPVLIGLAFLGRLGVYALRQPPAHASAAERAQWRRRQAARRRPPRPVRRPVARLGSAALPLLLAGFGTGLAIYAVDLRGDRPSTAMAWAHSLTATLGLLLVAAKLPRLPAGALRRGVDPGRAFR